MKKSKILIIDDDKWLAEEWGRRFKKDNFGVLYATNGLEAIDKVDKTSVDCIVLDMFLPGPNGLVFLHELKSYNDLAKIPVVMCTNAAHMISEDDLKSYGVYKLLDKSTMQPEDLLVAIKKVLS